MQLLLLNSLLYNIHILVCAIDSPEGGNHFFFFFSICLPFTFSRWTNDERTIPFSVFLAHIGSENLSLSLSLAIFSKLIHLIILPRRRRCCFFLSRLSNSLYTSTRTKHCSQNASRLAIHHTHAMSAIREYFLRLADLTVCFCLLHTLPHRKLDDGEILLLYWPLFFLYFKLKFFGLRCETQLHSIFFSRTTFPFSCVYQWNH